MCRGIRLGMKPCFKLVFSLPANAGGLLNLQDTLPKVCDLDGTPILLCLKRNWSLVESVWVDNSLLSQAAVNPWTQRTGRPFARLLSFSGFTFEELKFKFPAFVADDGEQLQEYPFVLTLASSPLLLLR